jgi:hypothetical protein
MTDEHSESGDKLSEPLIKVAVQAPFQVVHDERVYWPGAVAEVPQSLADKWIENRWVEVITDDAGNQAGASRRSAKR